MELPLVPPHIQSLAPYQAGRSIEEIRDELGLEHIIKLASNENPLGTSPKAIAAMQAVIGQLNRYPRAGITLRHALAHQFGFDGIDRITVGSGSEGVMLATMRAYLQAGDEAITAEGTFIGFYVIAHAMNLDLKTVPLTSSLTFDLDAILAAVTDKTKLIYIANPNNPTGTAIRDTAWRDFLAALPDRILVIMDEAYFEYASDLAPDYPDSIAEPHPQVLTLRTFSKAYGLAGVRIGFGVAHPEVIVNVRKVKLPFEPSAVAEAAGLGALEDTEFLERTLRLNREGLTILHAALDRLGLPHTDSIANFALIPFESAARAAAVSDALLQRGIIARPMIPFRLPHCVRITVGTPEETAWLVEVLEEMFGR